MKRLHVPAGQARRGDLLFLHDRYMVIEGMNLLPRTDRLALVLRSGGTITTVYCARDAHLLLRRPNDNRP